MSSAHGWPGNAPEISNAIERAMVVGIRPQDLPLSASQAVEFAAIVAWSRSRFSSRSSLGLEVIGTSGRTDEKLCALLKNSALRTPPDAAGGITPLLRKFLPALQLRQMRVIRTALARNVHVLTTH
jgi:hypothetical protein